MPHIDTSPTTTIPPCLEKVTPFPPIAARLLALLSDPSVDVSEVVELVRSDATLTARLLQRVNSVELGLVYPVSNVQHAVTTLGLDRTRQVLITQATAAYAKGALRTGELRRCWQHAVATAVLADQIAQACDAFVNIAFTAGIMHDIGRLGLLVAFPSEYERIIADAAAHSVDILDYERDEFGLHHAEAGRLLAERWGFPDELRIVAGRHHDPCEGTELDLLRIVHVACRLAEALGYDITHPLLPRGVDEILTELPPSAREKLHLTPEQLCARIEELILEHDSDSGDENQASAADGGAAVDETEDESAVVVVDEPGGMESSLLSRIVFGAMAALAALAAALAWRMQ